MNKEQQLKDRNERLEGLYNINLMKRFLDTFDDLVEDIQDEEPFEEIDIVEFLTMKMEERVGYIQ